MCSIAGYYNPQLSKQEYQVYNSMMSHRGPDYSEIKIFPFKKKSIFLAHNGFSIQDLRKPANQPMESERYVILLNGEIYNHLKIRKKLKKTDFQTNSDTETILYGFEEWGVERTILKINGMFAISLFDKLENKLYLIRDRMGVKPIYYIQKNSEFAFASTIKGLPKHLLSEDDNKAIIQFMSLRYVPSTNCYISNVQKIKPGFYIEFDGENIHEHNYWKIPKVTHDIEEENAVDRLEELIEKSIKVRLLADIEVGSFLSGGTNSSLVTAIASKNYEKRLKTFTIGFDEKNYDESGYAKKIADHLGTEHHEFMFKAKDVLSLLEDYGSAFDEPFGNVSSLPMMLLSREARQEVKVVLSGDGGNELFLGNERYFDTENYYNKLKKIPGFLRQPIGEFLKKSDIERLKGLSFPLKQPSPENIYASFSTALKPWEIKSIFNVEYLKEKRYSYLDLLELDYKIDKKKIEESLSFIDQRRFLCDNTLVKLDRSSMQYSLEARVPLLDYKIVEFANRLPLSMRRDKKIIKVILEKHLPKELISRPKHKFTVPLRKWFKKELKALLQDKIESLDYRFNKTALRQMLKEHESDNKNHASIFWNLLWVR